MTVAIACQKRPADIKPRALRRQGILPATLYGHDGPNSMQLAVNEKDFLLLMKTASVNKTLFEVDIPDMSWKGKAIIREIQAHPWKRLVYHVSFFAVEKQATIDVIVPVRLKGEAVGVKQGGKLSQAINEVRLKCPPELIPEQIEIDISNLGKSSRIHVSDLELPEGVIATDTPELSIMSISG